MRKVEYDRYFNERSINSFFKFGDFCEMTVKRLVKSHSKRLSLKSNTFNLKHTSKTLCNS